ncbi:hypothetical protein [Cellulomonas composti]|uniref:hypothetical protein n=1 Tax=Cellulomonas composti TaxID=266130 RepID=UPI001649DEC5|nr:hypothetical protein [Cellulomonas composti]
MVTHDIHPPVEHSTASLGAVVVSGVVLLGLLVGSAFALAQLVDLLAWAGGS